jgi:hypothetical protein
VAWAILAPGFAVHTVFGLASGFVSWQLVRGVKNNEDNARVSCRENS